MASERSNEVDKHVPMISCLDDLIRQLRDVFQTDCVNVDYVRSLLSAYKSNSKDWKKYAVFDPHRYTRNLVDAGNDRFNLIMLCWGESHGSSIHDHSKNAHCFVKILDGQLKETMFDWPTSSATNATEMIGTVEHQPLRPIAVNLYEKDGVTYINGSQLHHL